MAGDIFLLSPAYGGGLRARMLLEPKSEFAVARALAGGTLTLGDAFTFMSGLYFRGKLAYGATFGRALVITPTRGLMDPAAIVSAALLREFAAVDIQAASRTFRAPLQRSLLRLASSLEPGQRVVLLGSIATDKYVDVLIETLGEHLHFPPSFIGRGDMSRGGLMLRSARAGTPLPYAPMTPAATRRGSRPPNLPPVRCVARRVGAVAEMKIRRRRRTKA